MQKKIFLLSFPILFGLWILGGFFWWNQYPLLLPNSEPEVIKLSNPILDKKTHPLKALSYNIHFGIGLDVKTARLDKKGFENRLLGIAKILKAQAADIVFLQEVDFDCARSHHIDEATLIAKKADYPFLVKCSLLREKFHPSYHGFHGKIDHGLAILSKYPLKNPKNHIFSHPEEMPFYLRWLYCPHGIQEAVVELFSEELSLINVHLEPWSQEKRERESLRIKSRVETMKGPVLIGGDFNSLSPFAEDKTGYYLSDAPWFIHKDQWDLKNEKTMKILFAIPGISLDYSLTDYRTNENLTFTFPANHPIEKLDYFFARQNAKIEKSYVIQEATSLSDHLPIVTIFNLALEKVLSSKDAAHQE